MALVVPRCACSSSSSSSSNPCPVLRESPPPFVSPFVGSAARRVWVLKVTRRKNGWVRFLHLKGLLPAALHSQRTKVDVRALRNRRSHFFNNQQQGYHLNGRKGGEHGGAYGEGKADITGGMAGDILQFVKRLPVVCPRTPHFHSGPSSSVVHAAYQRLIYSKVKNFMQKMFIMSLISGSVQEHHILLIIK